MESRVKLDSIIILVNEIPHLLIGDVLFVLETAARSHLFQLTFPSILIGRDEVHHLVDDPLVEIAKRLAKSWISNCDEPNEVKQYGSIF